MTDATASVEGSHDPSIDMIQLVTAIARSLVDAPDQVSVVAIPEGDTVILRLQLGAGDIGKVIGRQGRTARSLRTILSAASMKVKRRYSLDIVEAS